AALYFESRGSKSNLPAFPRRRSSDLYNTGFAPTTEGVQGVQFNSGQRTPNGVLSQTFATTPGATYNLSFDLGVYSYQSSAEQSAQVRAHGSSPLMERIRSISSAGTET